MEEFTPHRASWTREQSRRFWSYMGTLDPREAGFFSHDVGPGLIDLLRHEPVPLGGRVLDFGCGQGHLLELLLDRGVTAGGADFSPTNVDEVTTRLGSRDGYLGATLIRELPSSLPPQSFETVLFVETIEHLLDGDLEATLAEIRRILMPRGTLVVTTPNEEKLLREETICPECGCVFHRMQHVRSWSAATLIAALEAHGFTTGKVLRTHLQATYWKTRVATLGAKLLRRAPRNLVWIGRKS